MPPPDPARAPAAKDRGDLVGSLLTKLWPAEQTTEEADTSTENGVGSLAAIQAAEEAPTAIMANGVQAADTADRADTADTADSN
jgi:hypothetical protein